MNESLGDWRQVLTQSPNTPSVDLSGLVESIEYWGPGLEVAENANFSHRAAV